MIKSTKMLGLAIPAMLFGLSLAAPAGAQATRTWISGVGDDVNPCSRTAPCKTFPGAISKTAAGGEIDCLDPGGFGGVTITKSITLDCASGDGGQVGSILVTGTNGITINIPSGPGNVVIRNLSINGIKDTGSAGMAGIRLIAGNSLTVEHTIINGFGGYTPTTNAAGVSFEPSAAGAKLIMDDVEIVNSTGNGIGIKPTGIGTAIGTLDRVRVTNSAVALQVEDNSTVIVTNSTLSNNTQRGVYALSSASGPVTVDLDGVTVANNAAFGIAAANATVRLSNVGLYNNANGIKISGTGAVLSFGNNRIGTNAGNSGTNATPAPVSPQ